MTKVSQRTTKNNLKSLIILGVFALFSTFLTPTPVRAANLESLAYVPILGQLITMRSAVLSMAGIDANAKIEEEIKSLPTSGKREPNKKVMVVMTAYTSTVDQCDDDPFIAASGKHVYDGMIAANWLPFGTKIKIPELYGDKIFTVDDRMNSRYGYGRMDIWLDTTKAEARKFGVKRLEIEIY